MLLDQKATLWYIMAPSPQKKFFYSFKKISFFSAKEHLVLQGDFPPPKKKLQFPQNLAFVLQKKKTLHETGRPPSLNKGFNF